MCRACDETSRTQESSQTLLLGPAASAARLRGATVNKEARHPIEWGATEEDRTRTKVFEGGVGLKKPLAYHDRAHIE